MSRRSDNRISYATIDLDGLRYAVIRESVLGELCRRAGVTATPGRRDEGSPEDLPIATADPRGLAAKLLERRKRSGLTQADLARRAGVRTETLNRIERGRTTPDFSTIRKLVLAMNAAETAQAASAVRRAISVKGEKA